MMFVNHGLSGYVCARVAAPLLRRYAPVSASALAGAMALGAVMPDFDIVSRLGGRALYFSDAWYAHRQASHSLLGTLLLALGLALAGAWTQKAVRHRGSGTAAPGASLPASAEDRRRWLWLAGAVWVGGLLHLLGDLFTPGMPLPLLWPQPLRFGSWSHIGWFSPYLLWLFLATLGLDQALRALARTRWFRAPAASAPSAGTVFSRAPVIASANMLAIATWGLYLLAAFRWVEYMVLSRYHSADQWSAYQATMLPDWMVTLPTEGVRTLWLALVR